MTIEPTTLPALASAKELASAGARWQPPSWLAAWSAAQPVPVSKAEVELALALVQAALRPAPGEMIAAELERTLSLYQTPREWSWERVGEFYAEAVEDVPPATTTEGAAARRAERSGR